MSAVTIALLAGSLLGNVILGILYGRAVKRAAERDAFAKSNQELKDYADAANATILQKEQQLREVQKAYLEKLDAGGLADALNGMFPVRSDGGSN